MAVIAVKYCGGCNPRYDRVQFVQDLRESLPEFEFSGTDAFDPEFALIVCGCPARCVSHGQIAGRWGKFVVASPEHEPLTEALRKALRQMR